ncbi:MAG: PfkB family carbohydrate kinase [Chloroflexi bacterium]|nr:PfkB family carbohydrate kinase [Chloroflexota bacterium]
MAPSPWLLDDVRVMESVTAGYLYQQRKLFRDAAMIMMDGSLTLDAMETIARLAAKYQVPLCADPSSTRLTYKLRPFLSQLHLVVPNEMEAAALLEVDFFGHDPDTSLDLARLLVHAGVDNAVLTLSDFGLDYATSDETGYIPARYSQIVDNTGTGDAVTAAIIFGLINDLPPSKPSAWARPPPASPCKPTKPWCPTSASTCLYDHLIV